MTKKRKGINGNIEKLILAAIGVAFAAILISSSEPILQTILTEQIEKSIN